MALGTDSLAIHGLHSSRSANALESRDGTRFRELSSSWGSLLRTDYYTVASPLLLLRYVSIPDYLLVLLQAPKSVSLLRLPVAEILLLVRILERVLSFKQRPLSQFSGTFARVLF